MKKGGKIGGGGRKERRGIAKEDDPEALHMWGHLDSVRLLRWCRLLFSVPGWNGW